MSDYPGFRVTKLAKSLQFSIAVDCRTSSEPHAGHLQKAIARFLLSQAPPGRQLAGTITWGARIVFDEEGEAKRYPALICSGVSDLPVGHLKHRVRMLACELVKMGSGEESDERAFALVTVEGQPHVMVTLDPKAK